MIENEIVELLIKKNLTISFAESATGGLLASTIISVCGASNILKESYITYSNESKMKILNVKQETINKYSVYSKEVAEEMVNGLYNITLSDICVSITGIAESNSIDDEKPFFYSIKTSNDKLYSFESSTIGSRNDSRYEMVNIIFSSLYRIIKDI